MTDTFTSNEAAVRKGASALGRGDVVAARAVRDELAREMVLQSILARIATLPDE